MINGKKNIIKLYQNPVIIKSKIVIKNGVHLINMVIYLHIKNEFVQIINVGNDEENVSVYFGEEEHVFLTIGMDIVVNDVKMFNNIREELLNKENKLQFLLNGKNATGQKHI